MKKDAFDSNMTQFDNQSGSSQEHGKQKHTFKKSQEDRELPARYSRERQKTTAIALSVITCLFMCVIGYEIIRESQPQTEATPYSAKNEKNSFVLSKAHASNDHQFLAEDYEPEDYESNEIRRLREQNRSQANKIKALRQELIEKMQATHEIKSNLFKIEGDPKDRTKINELSQKLEEAVSVNYQLGLTVRHMENELSALVQKINQTEVTRDALAAMLTDRQSTRDQEIEGYKIQLANSKEASNSDKQLLETKLQHFESIQKQLTAVLEEKSVALGDLEDRLATQKELHALKSKDLDIISNLYSQTQEEMKTQILALTLGFELESTLNQRLSNELTENSESQNAENAYVIALFESALDNRNRLLNDNTNSLFEKNNHIALQDDLLTMRELELNDKRKTIEEKKNEWAIQGQTLAKAKLSEEKAQEIIATLEWEMTRSEIIENEFKSFLREHRYTLQEKNDRIQKLERELNRQHVVLETKTNELEALIGDNNTLTAKKNELSKQQLELTAQLEFQISRDEAAKQHAEDLSAKLKDGNLYAAKMEDALSQALALAEIGTIHASYAEEIERQIYRLRDELTTKKDHISALEGKRQALEKSLDDALSHAMALADIGTINAGHVEQRDRQVYQLKDELTTKGDQISALEAKKQALEKSLDDALSHAMALADIGTINASHVEQRDLQVYQLKDELSTKEDIISSLEGKRQALERSQENSEIALNTQILQLTQLLEGEVTKFHVLEEELQKLMTSHESAQFKSLETEKKLKEAIVQASRLDDRLKAYHESLSAKELEIQSIMQAKSNVEDSLGDQINQLYAKIEQEKFKSESIHQNYREVKSERNNHADKAQKFESKYQVASLRLTLLEDELALHKSLLETQKETQQNLKLTLAALAAADEGLELQKEKNLAVQSEMKHLLLQYSAEQQRANELEERLQGLNTDNSPHFEEES